MAWTAPSTKSLGSTISKADWDTYVRDNLRAIMEKPTARLIRRPSDADVSLPSGTSTSIEWLDDTWDSSSLMRSTVSNYHRVNAARAGIHLVTCTAIFGSGDADGYRQLTILRDGTSGLSTYTSARDKPDGAADRVAVSVWDLVEMASGDYVYAQALQDSGSTLTLYNGNKTDSIGTTMTATWVASATASADAYTGEGWGSSTDPADWWNTEVVGTYRREFTRPACRYGMSSTASCSNNTWTTITGGTETFDNDSMHSTSTNNSRATASRAGLYMVGVRGDIATNTSGYRAVRILKNGTATGFQSDYAPNTSAGIGTIVWVSAPIHLNAGDYVEGQVFQNSGSTLDYSGSLRIVYLGAITEVDGAQRLTEGWQVTPYSQPATYGYLPRSWVDVHTRDMIGLHHSPPMYVARAKQSNEIGPNKWEVLKWNRQVQDPWDLVKGKRNAGDRFVCPIDGLYIVGAQCIVRDDDIASAKVTAETKSFTVDTATDICTATGHGFRTGTEVRVSATAMPGGLSAGVDYYVRRVSADTFTFHATKANAQANASIINLTTTGTSPRVSRSIMQATGLNLRTGARVRFSTTTTLPAGLTAGTDYYAIRIGPKRFRVAETEQGADDGVYAHVTDNGTGTHTVQVMEPFGMRGIRIVHSGEVQAGWMGAPTTSWQNGRSTVTVVLAKAEDELWIEGFTRNPEGSRLLSGEGINPDSQWWVAWLAPDDYGAGALASPIQDRG